jgi:hypothetical protein
MGMIGGGEGAFIGAVHRIAAAVQFIHRAVESANAGGTRVTL